MHTWMLSAAVAVGVTSFLPRLAPAFTIFLLVCAAAALLFSKYNRKAASIALGLFCGGCYAAWHATLIQHTLLPKHLEQEILRVQGYVVGLPRSGTSNGRPVQRFTFAVESSTSDGLPVKLIELSWYAPVEVHSGQRWQLLVKLKRPRGFANPGSYDYQLALHQRQMDARGYVKTGELLGQRHSPRTVLDGLREKLYLQLQQLNTTMLNARFLTALSIGEKKALQPADWTLLRNTGTTHLFVVSGLHISLVAGLFYAGTLYLAKALYFPLAWWPAQRYAALAACFAALAYALLAGFGLPTQRACVMLLVAMLGRIFNRPARVSGILISALFAVLLLDPLALRSAGFWLSFGAVTTLVLGFSGKLAAPGVVATWLRTQWLAFVVLTPLLLFWFQQASLLMPLANLFAVPLVSFVLVPLVLLVSAVLALGATPPDLLLSIVDHIFNALWNILELLQANVGATGQLILAPDFFSFLAALAGAGMLLLPRGFPLRIFAPLLFLPLLFGRATGSSQPQVELTVLDVGQGLALVLQVDEKTLVYDAGPRFSDSFDAGSAIVATFLRHRGIKKIDHLIVSHADSDHAGGLTGLLESLPVGSLLLGEPLRQTQPDATLCRAGDNWQWGVVKLQVLHPGTVRYAESNNNSCVLRISTPQTSVLVSGDIEAEAERHLVKQFGPALQSDILVVPHHGSKTSSTKAFIAAVNPRYALVSSGYLNRFGHPHETVTQRYEQAGTQLLNTALTGSIAFKLPARATDPPAAPKTYREAANRYWYSW